MIGSSHIGICVSDLSRSLRFYTEGLGELERGLIDLSAVLPSNYRRLLDIEDSIHGLSKFVDLDGILLELLYYRSESTVQGHVGTGDVRPMNKLGLTHLALRIANVEEFQRLPERVLALGGRVLEGSRLDCGMFDGQMVESVFVTDPDGTRIELMRMPQHYPMGGTLYAPRTLELADF